MNKQNLSEKMKLLGLRPYDLEDVVINSTEDLIEHVIQSGLLYRTSIKQLTLRKLRTYLENESIQPNDKLDIYFPKKYRKNSWNGFRSDFPLKGPGLKLTRFAQILCLMIVLCFIYLNWLIFTEGIEIILALKLAGLSLYPFLVMLFLPLGIIMTFGINRLPTITVNDLMDKIVSLNQVELLSHDKVALKNLLKKELAE